MFGGPFSNTNPTGFNQQQPQQQQQQQQQQQSGASPFGAPSNVNMNMNPGSTGFGFGNSNGSTNSNPASGFFGTPQVGQVQAQTPAAFQSPFGTNTNAAAVNNGPGGTVNPFANSTGFTVAASPAPSTNATFSSPFGSSSTTMAINNNNTPSSAFGNQGFSASNTMTTAPSVFGTSNATASPAVFNTAATPSASTFNNPFATSSNISTPAPAPTTGFGSATANQSPFGTTNSNFPPQHQQREPQSGLCMSTDNNTAPNPFASTAGSGKAATADSNSTFGHKEWVNPNSKKTQNEDELIQDKKDAAAANELKLAKLKALLEEKRRKKKLLEKMKAKGNMQNSTPKEKGGSVSSQPVFGSGNAAGFGSFGGKTGQQGSGLFSVNSGKPPSETFGKTELNPSAAAFTPQKSKSPLPPTTNFQKRYLDKADDKDDRDGNGNGKHSDTSSPFRTTRSAKWKDKKDQKSKEKGNLEFSSAGNTTTNSIAKIETEGDRNTMLAAKNATRFAQTSNRPSISMLPADLQQKAREYHPSQSSNYDETDDTDVSASDNSNSKGNLVGACPHMCPDEELIRREAESDIQMLELPVKSIYPKEWTLRDTAVKRFRRSAADFKLDIPSLVRPPAVLERVCGYLEEWVMERDRQGVDERFDKVPPPLDVYQFVWDRTRMIRKDFILQNFVGTGGRCNAVAVRCHERIARWHVLCEHQLSHLEDFRVMQSQQNIQELGATMKSLNMLYDDAQGRSMLGDTDSKMDGSMRKGCQSGKVMGNNPKNYDGQPLFNEEQTAKNAGNRIIRPNDGTTKVSGTAEPEMRGLYILLTINNDGGMEVLKYAGRLSRDRPEVFNSAPVQLALQVYKAKREYNYARFFKLLRSPSTPYLFACVMFKYVETMRKAAFRIMAKTFGTKRKDNGEGVNDHYPLQNLVHLLGFEDLDEASHACRHYNITVKPIQISKESDETVDIIFWRGSEFKEPRDPEKGIPLPLKPRKMNRIIESKLGGVTRLAICRGEVSGPGATLDVAVSPEYAKRLEEIAKKREHDRIERQKAIAKARRDEIQMKMRLEKIKREKEEQLKAEKIRRESEVKQKLALEEARQKEAERIAEEKRKLAIKQAEMRKKEKERLMQEAEKRRKKAEDEEKQRVLEAKWAEEQRQRKEILRLEAEAKRRDEEAAAERRRLFRIEKERKEELERIRKAKEEQQLRVEMEWKAKIEYARKLITLKRWHSRLSACRYKREGTKASIESFDPLQASPFRVLSSHKRNKAFKNVSSHAMTPLTKRYQVSYQDIFYRLATNPTSSFRIHEMLINALYESGQLKLVRQKMLSTKQHRHVFVFKIGVLFEGGHQNNDLQSIMKMWIDSRLLLGQIQTVYESDIEVRAVVSYYESKAIASNECDAVLVMYPPGLTKATHLSSFPVGAPFHQVVFDETLRTADDFNRAFYEGCYALVQLVVASIEGNDLKSGSILAVEKFPLRQLCCIVLRKSLASFDSDSINISRCPAHRQRESLDSCSDRIIIHCAEVLVYLLGNMHHLISSRPWPAPEFVQGDEVPGYFTNDGEGLPIHWKATTEMSRLKEAIGHYFPSLMKDSPTFIELLHDILIDAPIDVQKICSALLNESRLNECIDSALQWYESGHDLKAGECNVYLPIGGVAILIDNFLEETLSPKSISAEKAPEPNIFIEQEKLDVSLTDYVTESERNGELYYQQDENALPAQMEFLSYPQSSNKRPNTPITEDSTERKRIKVGLSNKGQGISDELQKSRSFTNNLKSICDNDSGLAAIIRNPFLDKIIQSDEHLQNLIQEM